jgi:triacylglycerol lipase
MKFTWALALALVCLTPFTSCSRRQKEHKVVAVQLMQRQPLRYPIVLVHGATVNGSKLKIGWMDFGNYFAEIPEYYGATGTPVKIAELTSDGSIAERAMVLKNFLETEMKGQMVNIVAHSLGGLDARYAVVVLGCSQIASITTIGTPHKGTPLANWADRQIRKGYPWYWLFRLMGYDMAKRRFIKEITTKFMAETFNQKVPDPYDIRKYSVVSEASYDDFNLSYLFWFPSLWLENEETPMAQGPNDGMVPTESQEWGKVIGRFKADHLAQINHHEFRAMDMSEISRNIYQTIYDNLSKEGL